MNAPEPLAVPAKVPVKPPALEPALEPTPPVQATDLKTLLDDTETPPWYARRSVWAAAVVLLLAGAGLWWWLASRAANAAPSYTTQAVTRGDLTLTVTANGTLQPTRAINIGSELSGTVLKVNVDVNDPVKKGQVLVVLDPAKLRDQVARSQAAVTGANAQVAQAEATTRETAATLARLEEVWRLSAGQAPSATELDASRATLARAQANASSARAAVTEARAALSTDQTNLGKASISAPADGVVLTRNVDPGNAVAASLQAVTLFSVAEDMAKLRLWVYVDEADVGSVKVGQSATFTVSAYASRPFPARITRVGLGSTITDNVVTYLTYLDVDNADGALRPGMTATAIITATERKNVLLVPNSALRFTPSTAVATARKGFASSMVMGPQRGPRRQGAAGANTADARQVWVLKDGVPVAVAVRQGITDGRLTEVLSGDLTAGTLVITAQQSAAP